MSRLTSWTLQEMAVHNLTDNFSVISKHFKGGSGKWAIFRKRSEEPPPSQPTNGDVRGAPRLEIPGFWYTNIAWGSFGGGGVKTALSTKHRKRLAKSFPSKGGVDGVFRGLRPRILTRTKGKGVACAGKWEFPWACNPKYAMACWVQIPYGGFPSPMF